MSKSVAELVAMIIRGGTDTPEDYNDADPATRRYVEAKANETDSTPEVVWAALRAEREAAKVNANDPAAIAKAARRR